MKNLFQNLVVDLHQDQMNKATNRVPVSSDVCDGGGTLRVKGMISEKNGPYFEPYNSANIDDGNGGTCNFNQFCAQVHYKD